MSKKELLACERHVLDKVPPYQCLAEGGLLYLAIGVALWKGQTNPFWQVTEVLSVRKGVVGGVVSLRRKPTVFIRACAH